MPCYHPLFAIPDLKPDGSPYHTKNGKIRYKIIGDDVSRLSLLHDDSMIQIPCGKCIGCRLAYSRRWADRLMLELQDHDSAWFVTLTYNDDCVPRRVYGVDGETGEAAESLSLDKRDIQLFLKRLRKIKDADTIRYYIAGEYGPTTLRPHYHGIFFGLSLSEEGNEIVLDHCTGDGWSYYRSPVLERAWSVRVDEPAKGSIISPYMYKGGDGKWYETLGFVTLAKVCWETCAYVARYVTKKLNGPAADFYTEFNLEPPFALMSRKPGIGYNYYKSNPNIFSQKNINISTDDGGLTISIPQYFERLLERDDADLAAQRSELRAEYAKAVMRLKLEQSTLSLKQQLAVAEDIKLKRTKKLVRRDL